ncbi:hypothetical protein V6Z11_A05G148400 [Gossypium hirsutum]
MCILVPSQSFFSALSSPDKCFEGNCGVTE